jgi:branched-chain amino acid transport system substrate-binding protein
MNHNTLTRSLAAGALALCGIGAVHAQDDTIRIGGLATLEGAFAVIGQDAIRGIEMAIEEHGGSVAGKDIELIVGSSDGNPDVAVETARRLVEQDNVDVLIGPVSGSEGLAVKEYAKTQPGTTFINGASAAQNTTLRDPADNFFRFSGDGAQWVAGLGSHAYHELGYRNVVTVAEDYSFPYTQVFGFMAEFCNAGGSVVDKFWVPIGTGDYSSIIAQIPPDIDAIFLALGGSDSVNFLNQYVTFTGGAAPIIGGTTAVDQTVLSSDVPNDYLVGTITSGPIAQDLDTAAWEQMVANYHEMFPEEGLNQPSLFFHAYYVATSVLLDTLEKIDGDLSNQHAQLRHEFRTNSWDTPTGPITLDRNQQVIADMFLSEIAATEDGSLVKQLIQRTPQVDQALGMDREKFLAMGSPSRTNPSCP